MHRAVGLSCQPLCLDAYVACLFYPLLFPHSTTAHHPRRRTYTYYTPPPGLHACIYAYFGYADAIDVVYDAQRTTRGWTAHMGTHAATRQPHTAHRAFTHIPPAICLHRDGTLLRRAPHYLYMLWLLFFFPHHPLRAHRAGCARFRAAADGIVNVRRHAAHVTLLVFSILLSPPLLPCLGAGCARIFRRASDR